MLKYTAKHVFNLTVSKMSFLFVIHGRVSDMFVFCPAEFISVSIYHLHVFTPLELMRKIEGQTALCRGKKPQRSTLNEQWRPASAQKRRVIATIIISRVMDEKYPHMRHSWDRKTSWKGAKAYILLYIMLQTAQTLTPQMIWIFITSDTQSTTKHL